MVRHIHNQGMAMPDMAEERAVFVADDEPAVQHAVTQVLGRQGHTVRCFASGLECLDVLRRQGRDCSLLIAGSVMPGMNGIDLARAARRIHPCLPIVVVAREGDIPLAVAAIKAGATNLVERPLREDVLLPVVDAVLQERRCGDRLAGNVLTPAELRILRMVVDDRTTKEIAYALGCSSRTIETHRYRMMRKLKAGSTSKLVKAALAMGLGSL